MLCIREDCAVGRSIGLSCPGQGSSGRWFCTTNEGCTDRYIARGFLDSLADVCIYHTLKLQKAKAIPLALLVSSDSVLTCRCRLRRSHRPDGLECLQILQQPAHMSDADVGTPCSPWACRKDAAAVSC